MSKIYYKWEELNELWGEADYLWEEVMYEVAAAVRRGGGFSEYVKDNPWDKLRRDIGEEKTKKVIKLYCKVNDINYEKVVESRTDIKVSVNEFERFVKDGISIKVDLEK